MALWDWDGHFTVSGSILPQSFRYLCSRCCLKGSTITSPQATNIVQARVALNVAIYDKALRLSLSHEGASIGEIIDLINNDANRIVNSFHEIVFGVIAPFQIISMPPLASEHY